MEVLVKGFLNNFPEAEFGDLYRQYPLSDWTESIKSTRFHFGGFQNWNMATLYSFLTSCTPADLLAVAKQSRQISRQRFGNCVQLFAPLYLSNECDSICVYCGFSKNRKINRLTLDVTQMEQNFAILKKQGFDHVLLLTGESPEKTPLNYLIEAVKTAKRFFNQVSLEIYPLEVEEYALLVEAGASGLVVYQETYDYPVYKKMHLAGEKKDFFYRLNAPERALKAGFRRVGLGVLLGLTDAVTDVLHLSRHVYYLKQKYWRGEYTLSFPRINPEGLLSKVPKCVGEKDLIAIIVALRMVYPDIGFVLSTRENPEFRDRLLDLGMTHVSAGSKTNPGGYAGNESGEQFSIRDERTVQQVEHVLRLKGIDPVLKDWEKEFEGIRS